MQIKARTVAAMILGLLSTLVAVAQQQTTPPPGDSDVDIAASIKQLKNRDKVVLKYDKFKDYTDLNPFALSLSALFAPARESTIAAKRS